MIATAPFTPVTVTGIVDLEGEDDVRGADGAEGHLARRAVARAGIVATTFTLIAVFLPTAFMSGVVTCS